MIFLIVLSPIILTFKLVMYVHDNVHFPSRPRKEKPAEYWEKRNERNRKFEKVSSKIGKVIVTIFLTLYALIIIIAMIAAVGSVGLFMFLVYLFSIVGVAGTFVGLAYLLFIEEYGSKLAQSPIVQIPVQMVSAIYHKMCPLINWVDKTENVTE
jgi:nitrate reductase NapE component